MSVPKEINNTKSKAVEPPPGTPNTLPNPVCGMDVAPTTPASMAGLLAIFAEFEREILRERTRAGLAHACQNGKRLGRPATAAVHAAEIGKLYRAGASRSEIARRLQIGRTSVRRVLVPKG